MDAGELFASRLPYGMEVLMDVLETAALHSDTPVQADVLSLLLLAASTPHAASPPLGDIIRLVRLVSLSQGSVPHSKPWLVLLDLLLMHSWVACVHACVLLTSTPATFVWQLRAHSIRTLQSPAGEAHLPVRWLRRRPTAPRHLPGAPVP